MGVFPVCTTRFASFDWTVPSPKRLPFVVRSLNPNRKYGKEDEKRPFTEKEE